MMSSNNENFLKDLKIEKTLLDQLRNLLEKHYRVSATNGKKSKKIASNFSPPFLLFDGACAEDLIKRPTNSKFKKIDDDKEEEEEELTEDTSEASAQLCKNKKKSKRKDAIDEKKAPFAKKACSTVKLEESEESPERDSSQQRFDQKGNARGSREFKNSKIQKKKNQAAHRLRCLISIPSNLRARPFSTFEINLCSDRIRITSSRSNHPSTPGPAIPHH